MARPSEYDLIDLKQFKGVDVIYALFTDGEGIRYIGYSQDVYQRFQSHLRNSDYETNIYKQNWIKKNEGKIKIKILSIAPLDWQKEEIKYIKHYNPLLLNICDGGKNNLVTKPFEALTKKDHLEQINQSLSYLNKYFKSKGRIKRYELLDIEKWQ